MNRSDIEAIYALSAMQEGMLFETLYVPESRVYFEQTVYTIYGPLDVPAFKKAWQKVVGRHPVLRTLFLWEGYAKPRQVVRKDVELPWISKDWRGLSPGEQQRQLDLLLEQDQIQGFKLSQAPLLRLALIQSAEDKHFFIKSFHHLLLDRWSSSLVTTEAFAFYQAFQDGRDLDLQPSRPYRGYIAWLRKQDLAGAEAFWRQKLKGFSAPTILGVDRSPATLVKSNPGYEEQQIRLSVTTTSALEALAKLHRLTLATIVQGAWALLLSHYSDKEDVMFGATVSTRASALPDVESMVGLFLNTVPVRVRALPTNLLLPWLQQLQEEAIDVRRYEHTPLVKVQQWSEVPRGLPLFESILVFENIPVDGFKEDAVGNLAVRQIRSQGSRTNYPLAVMAVPGRELLLKVVYDRRRFDDATITRMWGHFQVLLEGMAANPDRELSDLPMLTEAEQHQLLFEWNDTRRDYPADKSIPELFETQVARSPDAVAVVLDDKQLTYRELNRRANQLAHYLRKLGVGPEVLVGIYMERSLEVLIGLLGILKAGGAYIPLDPTYPKERLAFMLRDAPVEVLLAQQDLLPALPDHRAQLLCPDSERTHIAQQPDTNPDNNTIPEHLAYVIYTSGSTGTPKGVLGLHGGLLNRFAWMWETYPFQSGEVCCQKTALNFVDSLWELLGPLLQGVPTVIIPDRVVKDPADLVQVLATHRVSRIVLVPSLLRALLDSGSNLRARLSSLKLWVTSGEALTKELAADFMTEMPQGKLLNLYGSSEVSADVTWHETNPLEENELRTSIGKPMANTQIYILDARRNAVPVGVPGEIYVGGRGLARGYHSHPELTAEKFVPNRFSDQPGARLYRTGDLARYLADGNIEFMGRVDHQVKIRGFRIEPGEIETVLAGHPAVKQAAVMAREDRPGEKTLVAYVVAEPQQWPPVSELRSFVKMTLPDYMVPSAFIILDAFPLTPNGKLDRKALPASDPSRPEKKDALVAPHTPAEKIIAEIWAKVLKLEQVGIDENFFDLGGHSLLATQVISRLRQAFQVKLPLPILFENPTVAALAVQIDQIQASEAAPEEMADVLTNLESLSDEEVRRLLAQQSSKT